MTSEKERENRRELFELIKENPDLPIVPMVDSEIVANCDYARWMGAWGSSYVGEYLLGEEQMYFREDDDPSEVDVVLEGELDEDYETMSETERQEAYAALPWIKAIIVNIDLP